MSNLRTCATCGEACYGKRCATCAGRGTHGHTVEIPIEQRFWPKVNKTETCWLWTAGTNAKGYGVLWDIRHSRMRQASRISWELHFGAIPKGLWVLHRCDVRLCVRPDHLFLGDNTANMRDAAAKGRIVNQYGRDFGPKRSYVRLGRPRKLSDAEVQSIRDQYAAGGVTIQSLADSFGISLVHAWRLIHRERRTLI